MSIRAKMVAWLTVVVIAFVVFLTYGWIVIERGHVAGGALFMALALAGYAILVRFTWKVYKGVE